MQRQPRLPCRQRSVPVMAGKKAAAKVALAKSSAALPGLQAAVAAFVPAVLAASALVVGAVALVLAFAPGTPLARKVSRSNAPYVLLAVAYGVVLAASWQADTLQLMMPGSWAEGLQGGFHPQFFPSLSSIQTLFSRSFTSASFLIHVFFINLFSARTIYNNGFSSRVPTGHSVLLAAFAGPLGVLSHLLTQLYYLALSSVAGRDMRPRPVQIRASKGNGVITLLPYEEK